MLQSLSFVADVIAVVTVIFAIANWYQTRKLREENQRERARQNKTVKLILHAGPRSKELPVHIRRAELTRAEVLGRIGMVPMKEKQERFSIAFINTPEFLERLNEIAASDNNSTLSIPCTHDELEQFNFLNF